MKVSQFRIYSLGIVVQNKSDDGDYIFVTPIEELSIQDEGLIFGQGDRLEGKVDSLEKESLNTSHTSKNYVKAKWRGVGRGNRATAPNVCMGETVLLFKYGNVDEYYWEEIDREPILRRLENVLYSFSNIPDGISKKQYDKKTSYWIQVSTRDKFVHLHTSDNDGEACTWDIKIDTRNGILTMVDGKGNNMKWNAVSGVHESTFNSHIIRNAPSITDNCKVHVINTNTATVNASSSATHDTPIVTNTGNLHTNGNDRTDGNCSIGGNLSVEGRGGDSSFGGNVGMSGVLTAEDVSTSGMSSANGHTHGNGNNGGNTTPPN